jgi:LysR family glycine cleavage system transcriptional activator
MSKLPPLTAIRAFEAAARHGSFTKAGEELGMTQAAISYQVKLLEDRVGMPLFLRQPRKVTLSDAGKRLAPAVAESFQRLTAAFATLRESDAGVLNMTVVTTFCTNWLVPRLGSFQMAHPQIAVRLDTTSRRVNFAEEEFDLGIRGGFGVWEGLKSHLLMPVDFAPLATPEFLARSCKIERAADLLKLPLLDWQDESWRQWFKGAGIEAPEYQGGPAMEAHTQQMLGVAALGGQGVALLTPAFFAPELISGRLVPAWNYVHQTEQNYWLVYPEERAKTPKIKAFRDWLLAEIAKDCDLTHRDTRQLAAM